MVWGQTVVNSFTTIITGPNGWSLPSVGFVNPSYISGPAGQSDPNGALGFDISAFSSVFIAFEGTYTGQTVLHQQTMDPTGLVGWFAVAGISPDAGTSATDSASTTGTGYVFPAAGVRHRVSVTALSTGTMIARIGEDEVATAALITAGGGGGGGGGGALTVTASTNPTPVTAGTGKPLNEGLFSNLFITPVTPGGSQVDLSAPSGVIGTDGATIASKTNPLDIEINGTVPLPTGASTAALQTTGNTSLATIATNTTGVTVAQGSTTAGQSGQLIQAEALTASPTYTTGTTNPLVMDLTGNLHITLFSGSAAASFAGNNTDSLATFSGASALEVNSFTRLFNGSSFDRARSIAGSFGSASGVGAVELAGAPFVNITTGTTTNGIKSGAGILHKLIVNTMVASATITVFDNTTATGTKIGTITLPSTITGDQPFTLIYDLAFATGLSIITSGATDITVVYR